MRRGRHEVSPADALYAEDYRVESYDVDLNGRMRPHAVLSSLLNTAWNHTRGTQAGYASLQARGLLWVLIGIRMEIRRLPDWGDRVQLRTWGRQVGRLYAMRDFALGPESGGEDVTASSSWMVLDAESGRPRRLEGLMDGFPWLPGRRIMESDPEKLPSPGGGRRMAGFPVLFSDIDVNGHVNSACYLRWMVDAHDHCFLRTRRPGTVELSFLAEALPNDHAEVFSEDAEGLELCAVRRASDGADLCRGRFRWHGDGRPGR